VYVFHSAGSAGTNSANDTAATATLTGTAATGWCGNAITVGDVNGNGCADVVFGAYGNNGSVFVFHSTGSGGIASADDTAASATLTGTGASAAFGTSVALRDFLWGELAHDIASSPVRPVRIAGRVTSGGASSGGAAAAAMGAHTGLSAANMPPFNFL